jgi:hypothetical protein
LYHLGSPQQASLTSIIRPSSSLSGVSGVTTFLFRASNSRAFNSDAAISAPVLRKPSFVWLVSLDFWLCGVAFRGASRRTGCSATQFVDPELSLVQMCSLSLPHAVQVELLRKIYYETGTTCLQPGVLVRVRRWGEGDSGGNN